MVLLWTILLEVLLCAEAQNVTEVGGQLGSEVTLTCSSQSADTYWYVEVHSQYTPCIGHSFSSSSLYCSPDFEKKFSILGNELVIKNVTSEDCRRYFCGFSRDNIIHIVETFTLFSAHLCLSSGFPEVSPSSDRSILYRSAILSTGLLILILVMVSTSLWLKRKYHRDQVDPARTNENAATL